MQDWLKLVLHSSELSKYLLTMTKPNDQSNGDTVAIPQPHGGALKPFQPGQSGNPAGKPKGTKHVSTWIQELLNDKDFDISKYVAFSKPYKGAPMEAIIITAVVQALQGDPKWADLLLKYGYGSSSTVEHSGTIKHVPILGGAGVQSNDSNIQAPEASQED
jgi:hypothetical protein